MQWIKPRTFHIQGKHYAIDLHLWKVVFEIGCFVSYIRYLTFSISLLRLFFFACMSVLNEALKEIDGLSSFTINRKTKQNPDSSHSYLCGSRDEGLI